MEDNALTPFAHTKGLYFNDKLEPQNEEYNIYKDIKKEMEDEGKLCVSIGKDDDPESYYDAMMKMKNLYYNKIKVVSKRDPETLYIDLDDDMDDRMI